MIRIDFSQLHQACEDAAAAMPSIAGKKILMGFWHNWPAGAADGYQQGSFANIALEDVPSEYNVVAVAFMKGRGIPTFQPYNLSDAEFRRQVGVLNAQGRAVLISLGGADAHIELHAGQEQALAAEIVRLVETYGFDGLDIDLEQSAIDLADNQRVLPAALKLVREHYAGQGKHFIVSMAPEFPYLHKNGKYVPYLQALEGVYDFIAPQYYNQGGDGLWVQEANGGKGAWIAQNNDAMKEDFLYYLTEPGHRQPRLRADPGAAPGHRPAEQRRCGGYRLRDRSRRGEQRVSPPGSRRSRDQGPDDLVGELGRWPEQARRALQLGVPQALRQPHP